MTARERHLWTCYRLTEAEYETILQHQGRVCAGCGRPPNGTRLAVDHDHKTGRIRGLLCWICNKGIGFLRDNAKAMQRLGAYLEQPTAPAALGKETYGLIGKAKASKKTKVYGPPRAVEGESNGSGGIGVSIGGVVRSGRKVRRPGSGRGGNGGRKSVRTSAG